MRSFKTGDTAFMLEHNRIVQQVTITDCFGGIYTIRLPGGGASKVRGHRLFATPDEAKNSVIRRMRPVIRQL